MGLIAIIIFFIVGLFIVPIINIILGLINMSLSLSFFVCKKRLFGRFLST